MLLIGGLCSVDAAVVSFHIFLLFILSGRVFKYWGIVSIMLVDEHLLKKMPAIVVARVLLGKSSHH